MSALHKKQNRAKHFTPNGNSPGRDTVKKLQLLGHEYAAIVVLGILDAFPGRSKATG